MMLFALITSVSLFFITLLIFVKTTPKHIQTRSKTRYNRVIFFLALFVCLMVYTTTYLNNGLSIERSFLSIHAYLQSLLAISMVLFVGGLFRNLIMFRKRKGG
jgi:cytochrome bd-type quinol oxidase subunit 2